MEKNLQQQISMVKNNLGELSNNVRLFRDQLRDLEIEAERVKEAILNDLFVLIKELSQTEDCWERTKSKISSIAH